MTDQVKAADQEKAQDGPRKFDQGKVRWDLMPWEALEAVARVITAGAAKYGERNWEGGYAWGRLFGAAMRHLSKWWLGEDRDPETGESHLAHAACCVLFLLTFWTRKVG